MEVDTELGKITWKQEAKCFATELTDSRMSGLWENYLENT